jgi:hypothetical protein
MMRREDCIFGKVIDLLVGVSLFVFGLFFIVTAFTIFPIAGFVFAIPALWLSFLFLTAPRDEACFSA